MTHRVIIGLILGAGLSGCTVETNDRGPIVGADSGSLVVDWTVDGVKDPDECDLSNSTTIDIIVTTENGAPAGEYQQSCSVFATTIHLAAGRYTADAVLLDESGRERTTAVPIRDFSILGGDQLTIPIDFGASSFYAP